LSCVRLYILFTYIDIYQHNGYVSPENYQSMNNMIFREIVAVYCDSSIQQINTPRALTSVVFFMFTASGTYSYH